MGLREARCNGCTLEQLKHELGDKFLMLEGTVYELDAQPLKGQGQPYRHNGHKIRFVFWGMSYGHSDECYHWKPPKKE
jgi:hypothetical protein